MWNPYYAVIGNKFETLCAIDSGIITEHDLIDKILNSDLPTRTVSLILEQGVNASNVQSAIYQVDPAGALFTVLLNTSLPPAAHRLTHKHKPENTLISYPRMVADNRFSLDLLCNTAGEFFADHMTGLHIQGIALIEAARQSFLAVTEEFYLRGDDRKYYFVIKEFNSKFLSFVFPIRATLDYEVKRYRGGDGRHSFDTLVRIVQAGQVCAEFTIGFTAFLADVIAEREAEKAQIAVDHCFSPIQSAEAPVSDGVPPQALFRPAAALHAVPAQPA